MQVTCMELNNKNKLNHMYRAHEEAVVSYFEYYPFGYFKDRLADLQYRSYQRGFLADVLNKMNKHWGATEATLNQIERLREPERVAVIGGRRVGLLTGPLY